MNLIPKICELLGVEIGEEFKISQDGEVLDDGALYKFNGIWFYKHNNADDNLDLWDLCTDSTLLLLLNGHIEIVKLPFEPKDGDSYFYVGWFIGGEEVCVFETKFLDCDTCYQHKYCGNCFRTADEAERHKYEIYEKLTGKKWEVAE